MKGLSKGRYDETFAGEDVDKCAMLRIETLTGCPLQGKSPLMQIKGWGIKPEPCTPEPLTDISELSRATT